MKNKLSQATQSHARYLVDGAFVESLGANSGEFQVTAPLINGISAAAYEDWNPDTLYPDTLNALFRAMRSQQAASFYHPELGELTCKLLDMVWDRTPNGRDGAIVEMTFLETLVDDESNSALTPQSFASAGAAAQRVKTKLTALPPSDDNDSFGLDDILDAIDAFLDAFAILGLEANMLLDSTIGKFQRLIDHAEFLGLQESDLGDFVIDCETVIAACYEAAQPPAPIGFKLLPADMTLPQAAAFVGNSPEDFLTLNVQLASFFIIDAGTLVSFYLD